MPVEARLGDVPHALTGAPVHSQLRDDLVCHFGRVSCRPRTFEFASPSLPAGGWRLYSSVCFTSLRSRYTVALEASQGGQDTRRAAGRESKASKYG